MHFCELLYTLMKQKKERFTQCINFKNVHIHKYILSKNPKPTPQYPHYIIMLHTSCTYKL